MVSTVVCLKLLSIVIKCACSQWMVIDMNIVFKNQILSFDCSINWLYKSRLTALVVTKRSITDINGVVSGIIIMSC